MKAYITELVVPQGATLKRLYVYSVYLVFGKYQDGLVAHYEKDFNRASGVKIIEEIEIEESLVEGIKVWIQNQDPIAESFLLKSVQNLLQ